MDVTQFVSESDVARGLASEVSNDHPLTRLHRAQWEKFPYFVQQSILYDADPIVRRLRALPLENSEKLAEAERGKMAGKTHHERGEYGEACREYLRVISLFRYVRFVYPEGEKLAQLQASIAASPEPDRKVMPDSVHYIDSLESLNANSANASKVVDVNHKLLANLIAAEMQLRHFEQVIAAADAAILIEKAWSDFIDFKVRIKIRYRLATAYNSLDQSEKALQVIQEALTLDPQSSSLLAFQQSLMQSFRCQRLALGGFFDKHARTSVTSGSPPAFAVTASGIVENAACDASSKLNINAEAREATAQEKQEPSTGAFCTEPPIQEKRKTIMDGALVPAFVILLAVYFARIGWDILWP